MATFDEAYAHLTGAQKKAVDTVEGPVLVIAGPGTGKTHVLTLRVANILKQTQANPSNILVLTFTESAARTVRKRLGTLIGEKVAQEVFIATFHSFAEHLLTEYAESFLPAQGKRLSGDVESTLLWREVLETEPLVHLRTTKSPYFYLRDLARLRDDLLRERITLDQYRAWAKEEEQRIHNDESLRYVQGAKKGELKPEGQKKIDRLEKIYEAASLIEAYEHLKEERGVYDFADVLRIAVDGLQSDEGLRATIQEQYQYILADEHQDANALQHALLDALAYDEHPNIFVVGDEKQAIYRFQGADSSHFKTFTEHFPRTEIVSLTDNYRSKGEVLTHAQTLIEKTPASLGTHTPLTAIRGTGATVSVLAAADPLAERDQVAQLVAEAIAEGVAPHHIAVIAARNETANLFAEHARARNIPVLRAGEVLLSSRPILRFILALMRTVASPLETASLREALLAPWWKTPLVERAVFLRTYRDHELEQALMVSYPDIAGCIQTLREGALSLSPIATVSKMLVDSGARAFMLAHAEHLEDLMLLRKIFMHIEEILMRDPSRSFAEVVETLTKAHEHGLESVKSSRTQQDGLVTVITAHKAKGMEFERVFIIGTNAREWEKGGKASVIPSPVDQTRTLEDITRLFYVAMTRAKDSLTISYALETSEGRELVPSILIPEGLPKITAAEQPLPVLHTVLDAPILVRDLVRRYLAEEGLSPSAMGEYLESPATFFVRRVLRLREPETPATVIGSAVHAAIAALLTNKDADATLQKTLHRSLLPRTAAFSRVVDHAERSFEAFKEAPLLGEVLAIEKAYFSRRTVHGQEVTLQGKVDALVKTPDGECLVDFKTSSTISIKDEKYGRQLAFYDFLLREEGHALHSARIIQVGPDGVVPYTIPLTETLRNEFATLLDAVLDELVRGTWRTGVASEYDDLLALFHE